MATIRMHEGLEYIRPDEMAECVDGVLAVPGLYEALWQSMDDMKPLGELIDMEESGPGDAVGLNSIASVWGKFSDDHKLALNALSKKAEGGVW